MKNNLFFIAKEGWAYLSFATLSFFVSYVCNYDVLAFIFFLTILFFAYVFKNPERELLSHEENTLVSPVDGKVILIEEIDSNEYSHKLTINSNYFDVSILRVPYKARVISQQIYKGTRLNVNGSLSKKLNENAVLIFEDENLNKIKMLHRSKESFLGIKIDSLMGDTLSQSLRYGLMLNGITEVYLPKNFTFNVKALDELHASQTLLGRFS